MATLANSPGACCIKSVEHSGTARGTTETIGGVPTYVSRPKDLGESRKIILFFSDVFGPFFLNSQLIMDYWASYGYLVVALDYFEGDPLGNYIDRVKEGTYSVEGEYVPAKLPRAKEITTGWLDAVRKQYGTADTKWVTVGYCFGAPFVMDCLAQDWITAGAFAHPGLLDENHFQNSKKPLLMSCAAADHTFPPEFRRKAEDILIEKKATYHIQVFTGVAHGFAVWGNVTDPVAKWAKEQSAATIMSWFNLFCA